MAKRKKTQGKSNPGTLSYELPVDLSENQIEADVANYFGFVSAVAGERFGHFRLDSLDEQVFGADKSFNDVVGATAYFLQFKKPIGLRPVTAQERQTPLSPAAGPKQHIRRFRSSEDLEENPYSVCFPLRKLAKRAKDLQHNILFQYERPPGSRAVYVCPLELTRASYQRSMDPLEPDRFPFLYYRSQWLQDKSHAIYFAQCVPFLRGHAAIVPHAKVATSDHYYSFSRDATDIVFHSPQRLQREPSRLSDYVANQIRYLTADDGAFVPIAQLADHLRELARPWSEADGTPLTAPESPDEWLAWHARELRSRFGILQLLVFRTQKEGTRRG